MSIIFYGALCQALKSSGGKKVGYTVSGSACPGLQHWAHVEATAWKIPCLLSPFLITLKTAASCSLPPTLQSLLPLQSICLCFGAASMFRCPSQAAVLSFLPPLSHLHGTLHRSSLTGSVPHLAPPKVTQTT